MSKQNVVLIVLTAFIFGPSGLYAEVNDTVILDADSTAVILRVRAPERIEPAGIAIDRIAGGVSAVSFAVPLAVAPKVYGGTFLRFEDVVNSVIVGRVFGSVTPEVCLNVVRGLAASNAVIEARGFEQLLTLSGETIGRPQSVPVFEETAQWNGRVESKLGVGVTVDNVTA